MAIAMVFPFAAQRVINGSWRQSFVFQE